MLEVGLNLRRIGWGAIVALVVLCGGCGRSGVHGLEDPSPLEGPSCLPDCLAVAGDLEAAFQVSEPCTEPDWAQVPRSCEACASLFLELYSVAVELEGCRDCPADSRRRPVCGVPPPECPSGTWPEIADCESQPCGECGPNYTGACEPCES